MRLRVFCDFSLWCLGLVCCVCVCGISWSYSLNLLYYIIIYNYFDNFYATVYITVLYLSVEQSKLLHPRCCGWPDALLAKGNSVSGHPQQQGDNSLTVAQKGVKYEGCSNMNASGFITFFTLCYKKMVNISIKDYMSPLNWPGIKKSTAYSSSYSPLNEGHVSILTNSMLLTYTSDIDERIILR